MIRKILEAKDSSEIIELSQSYRKASNKDKLNETDVKFNDAKEDEQRALKRLAS